MTRTEIEPETSGDATSWPKVDRRRSGRPEAVSAELVPLLRGQVNPAPDLDGLYGDPDQLRAARGLAVGAIFSCILWAGLAYLACLIAP